MALPEVGVRAVVENLQNFEKAADTLAKSLEEISEGSRGAEETSAGAASSFDMAGEVASSVASGGITLLIGAVAGVAAGFGLAATAGLDWAREMNAAMRLVQAQTGATDEQMADFRDSAEDIFQLGLGENFEEVASAMALVQRQTQAADEQLEQLTTDALVLDEVFDKEINESIRATDQAMDAFGITGQQTFDLITISLQRTGDPADDLLDTVNEYSPIFAQAGFNAQQMFSILNSGLDAGAFNADKVGDAILEMNVRLNEGGKEVSESFATLGMDFGFVSNLVRTGQASWADYFGGVIDGLRDIDDSVLRNQSGVAIFGTMWEDLGEDVILGLDPALLTLDSVEGATNRAQEAITTGLGPAWEQLTRTVQVSLADAFQPVLTTIVEQVTPAFEEFATWLQGPGQKTLEDFGLILTDLANVILPLLQETLTALTQVLSTDLAPSVGELATAFGELAVAFGLTEEGGSALTPTIQFLGEVLAGLFDLVTSKVQEITALVNAIRNITDESITAGDRLLALGTALSNLSVPDIFQPGSPTPFELALSGILGVLNQVTQSLSGGFNIIIQNVAANMVRLQSIMISTFTRSVATFTKLVIPAFQLAANAVQLIHDLFVSLSTDVLPQAAASINSFASDAASNLNRVSASLASMAIALIGMSKISFDNLLDDISDISTRLGKVEDRADEAENALDDMGGVNLGGLISKLSEIDSIILDIIEDVQDAIDLLLQLNALGGPSSTVASASIASPSIPAPALSATGNTTISNTFSLGGNIFNTPTDPAVFEQRVLNVIRSNL